MCDILIYLILKVDQWGFEKKHLQGNLIDRTSGRMQWCRSTKKIFANIRILHITRAFFCIRQKQVFIELWMLWMYSCTNWFWWQEFPGYATYQSKRVTGQLGKPVIVLQCRNKRNQVPERSRSYACHELMSVNWLPVHSSKNPATKKGKKNTVM